MTTGLGPRNHEASRITAAPAREPSRAGMLVSLALAGVAGIASLGVLVGYGTGYHRLVAVISHQQAMSPWTALMCIALAVAVWADVRGRSSTRLYLSLGVMGVAATVLLSQICLGYDVISDLTSLADPDGFRPQVASATAGCCMLLALGFVTRPRRRTGVLLAASALAVAGLVLLGYLYGIGDIQALPPLRTISLRSASCLFLLGMAALLSNGQADVARLVLAEGVTGRATRRQLAFLVVPPLAGYLLLRAMQEGQLGPAATVAILVVITVVPLGILILRDARAAATVDETRRARRRSDAAKLAFEERYGALFQSIEVGFCIIAMKFDADGRPVDYAFLEVNPAFEAQTGIQGAAGRLMRDIAPGHEQHWFDLYGRVASTGESARFENEAEALGRWYDVHAFRIDEPEKRHVAVLFSDITARRRMELALKEMNATLEQRVAHEVEERGRAEEAFRQSQKMEAVGQLTGGVAHDFNNLLTVLRSSVDLLRKPGLAEDRRTRYLEAISDTVDRAAKLTSQLLAFARRQALKPEVFDAVDRLRTVADMLDTVTGARIRVVADLLDDPRHILADPSQFETALVNMAINARDAMEGEGSLTLRIVGDVALPPIRGHAGGPGPFVAVSLTDTGGGIPPDDVARVFEPFFTTKDVGKGTGLGLSQVFGFAKQSGGDVDVDSRLGQGTTFTLYLPQVHGIGLGEMRSGAGATMSDGGGRRVLVVEDNVEIGRFATQILDDLGYRTEWATTAAEALDRLATAGEGFDVVFSDVVMPGGMNGIDLACAIRERHPDLPVVLTSGYSHVLAEEGPHGFDLVHKPYSADQLSAALRGAMAS